MTEKQIEKLFDKWKPRLGLFEWQIEIVFGCTSEPDSIMECIPSTAYNLARITVSPGCLRDDENILGKMDSKHIEICVIHELLHCVVHPMDTASDALLKLDVCGKETWELYQQQLNLAEEQVIDKLARSLYKEWK